MKQSAINVIEQQVICFRQNAGLNTTEPLRLKSLLLKLNVLTIYRPLSESFSGLSIKDKSGHRFMLVNSDHPRGRQHFTIAHELYHLFIEDNPKPHRCDQENKKDTHEKYADKFASMLLLPDDGVKQMIPKRELEENKVSMATILRLEQYFSVSHTYLLNRLCDLCLITPQQKQEKSSIPIIKIATQYGFDTSLYKKGNENIVIGDFGQKVNDLFDKGLISEGYYIELLNKLNIDDQED